MDRNPEYDIYKAMQRIENELIQSMIRNFDRHRAEEKKEGYSWTAWQAEQLKALEQYKQRNLKKYQGVFGKLNSDIESMIRLMRRTGRASQEIGILEALKKGYRIHKEIKSAKTEGRFFKVNDRKLNALIKATMNDMEKAEQAVLRMANDKYRKAIFAAQVYANTGAGTYEKAVDMATKDMLSAGLNCVEYKNGARHTLANYARMAIKTANKRAYLMGEGEKRAEWGVHTVILKKRGNACPLCLPFVGKVLIDDVYSGGTKADGNYPLLSAAMAAGLYHPNCKDIHTTYFPGISTPPEGVNKEDVEKAKEDYTNEQKQNYCKNNAERFQRMSENSLDPDNKRKYAARAKEWEEKEKSLRTKNGGSYGVNWNIVKSKEYTKRFETLSDNQKANKLIAKRSRNALLNRNGKNTEELYAISLTTGKDISSITDQNYPFGVMRTEKFNADIARAEKKGEQILFIHNHPKGLPPSIADLNELLAHENAAGITVGHNGSIYYYSKPNEIITKFDERVAMRKAKEYNGIEGDEKVLEILSKQFCFEFKKI